MTVDLQRNFFELFDLPQRFHVDLGALEAAYHDLHAQVHPDRHAHQPEAQRRQAMQWATRVNEGFRTLRNPLARAQYLLALADVDTGLETNTAMSPAFLMEQMEWREGLDEAKEAGDATALTHLHTRLRQQVQTMLATLEQQLDVERDLAGAAETVRRLMFSERLRHDIDDALEALDS